MIRWLSRRHPLYIRSLVYMLQASEYNIADFWRWHERTTDFRTVEKRKQLAFTPKATYLYLCAWALVVCVVALAAFLFLTLSSPWNYLVAVFIFLETPLIVVGGLTIDVFVLHLVQGSVERRMLTEAKARLASHKAVKIAIAGSYGKTSIREILKTVLGEGKKVAAPGRSYNTPLGIAKFIRTLKGDEDVLIFELGEYYPGDVRKLARMIRPDWGVITGVNEAHLEKFRTLERTADTIFELAEFVPADHLYVNGENNIAKARAKSGNIVYSRGGAGQWKVTNAETGLSGTSFVFEHDGVTIECYSKLLGLHMTGPLALAAELGYRLGLTNEQIGRGIAKTKPFEHRLEPRTWEDGVTFLDDSYNGNPDGVRAVIEFLASLKGRRFYVTPGLVEAGPRVKEVHEEIGQSLAKAGIEKVVLISNSVTPYIETGLASAGFKGEVLKYASMPICLNALRSQTLPGDVILVQNDWPDQYA